MSDSSSKKNKKVNSSVATNLKCFMAYLASGVIQEIVPGLAGRIVKKYGNETFDVFERSREELVSIRGISRKKLHRIKDVGNENDAACKEIDVHCSIIHGGDNSYLSASEL